VTSYTSARGSYGRGDEQSTFAGGVLLAIIASLAAVLVLLGLVYAAGTPARHQRALAAGGCEPNLSPNGLPCTTVWQLEGRWTALTTKAYGQLNTDVAAYNGAEFQNLASAKVALTAELTTARTLDATLAQFPFPPDVAARASALRQAILARVKVMIEQVKSTSLAQLRSADGRPPRGWAQVATFDGRFSVPARRSAGGAALLRRRP
jgi:hypothetical protein